MEAYFVKCEQSAAEAAAAAGTNSSGKKRGKPKVQQELVYTYKIKKGISDVHGSLSILKKMDYPLEIIDEIET